MYAYNHTIYTGFAGSDEKVAYLKELGFDEAVNYKKVDTLSGALQQTCPKGIDMFLDNVSVCMIIIVCMYVCIVCNTYIQYRHAHAHAHTHTHAHAHTHTCIYMYIYTYIHTYI